MGGIRQRVLLLEFRLTNSPKEGFPEVGWRFSRDANLAFPNCKIRVLAIRDKS